MAKMKGISVEIEDVENLMKRDAQRQSDTQVQQQTNETTQQHIDTTTKIRAQRTNGSTYYLEDFLRKKMKMASALQDIDMQNIVRASVDYFFEVFGNADGMGLTQEGQDRVGEYLKKMEERARL